VHIHGVCLRFEQCEKSSAARGAFAKNARAERGMLGLGVERWACILLALD